VKGLISDLPDFDALFVSVNATMTPSHHACSGLPPPHCRRGLTAPVGLEYHFHEHGRQAVPIINWAAGVWHALHASFLQRAFACKMKHNQGE